MRSGPVSSWLRPTVSTPQPTNHYSPKDIDTYKALARDNESSRVRTPVEAELDKDVDDEHSVRTDVAICKAPHYEEDGKTDEPDQLQGATSNGIKAPHG